VHEGIGEWISAKLGEVAFLVVLGVMVASLLASVAGALFVGAAVNAAIEVAFRPLRPIEGAITFVTLIAGQLLGPWVMLRVLRWSRRRAATAGFEWSTDDGRTDRAPDPRRAREPRRPLDPRRIADLDARLAEPGSRAGERAPQDRDR
jgi:hypothetical protein